MTADSERLGQALGLLGRLVLDSGLLWGEVATAVQRADAEAILAEAGPRRHWLGRARGYSKTTDVAGLCLVILAMLPPGSECVAAAADADQAGILVRRMRGLLTRTGGLAQHYELTARRVTFRQTGSFVEVLASDGSSAWGLQPAVVVLDEFAWWPETANARELLDALVTALPKTPGSRLVVMSTAGDPAGWAAKLHATALSEPAAWRVSEPAGPAPWMDQAEIDLERRRLPESLFRRLFWNEWTASEDRLVDPGNLDACAVLDGPLDPVPGVSYRVGVDLGLRGDRTVIAVAHAETAEEGGRRVVLDRMLVYAGSREAEVSLAEVEAALLEVARRYRARIVGDPWQAVGMFQRLRAKGLRVEEFTFSGASVARLASTLHVLLRDRMLALPRDPELLDELANVRLRETSPGVLRLDHDSSRHDDRAVALGLAAQALLADTAVAPASLTSFADRRLPATTITRAPTADTGYAGGGIPPRRPLAGSRQAQLARRQGRVITPGSYRPPKEGRDR